LSARLSATSPRPPELYQGTACNSKPPRSCSARSRGCSMLVVIRNAPVSVTRAHTSAGSSLRTTRSSRPPVTQATPACEVNRAAP
jgi:hypothetical protein